MRKMSIKYINYKQLESATIAVYRYVLLPFTYFLTYSRKKPVFFSKKLSRL